MTIETTTLNPQVIFVSATTPSDTTEGKMWYNTTNKTLYVSNGTSYVLLQTDLTTQNNLIQENALNILINSAGATTTLNDWDEMIVDRFTDATGQLNTIDTTNTTAGFSTNKYENMLNEELAFTETGNANATPTKVATLDLSSNPKKVIDVNGFINRNGNGSSVNCYMVFNYTDQTNGQSATQSASSNGWIAKTWTNPNQTKIVNDIDVWLYSGNVVAVSFGNGQTVTTTSIANTIVETNPQTIDSGVNFVQIYSNNTTSGTGSITADVSVDGGSTWTTGIQLNTKTAITSTDGTSLIMKLNLNGAGTGNTATASDYAIMLFY